MNNFVISGASEVDSLKTALLGSFPDLKETSETERFEIHDTFDWRLYHKGWLLLREGNRFALNQASDGRAISGLDANGKKGRLFAWDLPASDFRDCLSPVLEMRALIPMADIENDIERLAVCNGDEKTVARIELSSLGIAGGDCRITHCRLLPIRGYGKDSRRIRALFKELDLTPATKPAMEILLRGAGIDPGAYSPKVNVVLEGELPAAKAVQRILENLVTVMHQNFEGVCQDIDTEFLHDFRVAIRRARSLVGQTRGVLVPEITASLQEQLKTMGSVSGQVRDLDVYLLKKEAYVEMVPDVLRPGVRQLFRVLQRRRRAALNRMLKVMGGAEFKAAMAALDSFLQSDPVTDGNASGLAPAADLARTVIYKRFRRILKKGGRITADTPDQELHDLRIDCKKLRYLLEFFISLFPADEMKRLIKQLKQLQENLGDFNDLCVQQEFLTDYLESIKPNSPQSVMLSAATGGLISRLATDQARVRSEFLGVFKAFSASNNKARFKTLFT